jgi:hypothetical protein
MPEPLSATSPLNQFSEERAMKNLVDLTSLGPRVDGTPTQITTQKWILDRIQAVIDKYPVTNVRIELDQQNFTDTTSYRLMTNLYAKLSSDNIDKKALLIASHYDTIEHSFGGSDDGTGVVTMLELINNLVSANQVLSYPIIFLFSDGEEAGIRGSAMFEKHKWFPSITRFINMDSSGSKGKAIMFRIHPTGLISEYAKVPRPHTTVIGEEVMQFVPADTDFTSFKNAGMIGFDYAFYYDGYSYHTRLDNASVVERGALQHLGDNVMSMITSYQSSSLLKTNTTVDGNYVYYDAFGLFLVYYNYMTGVYVHITLIVVSLVAVFLVITVDHVVALRVGIKVEFSLYQYFPKTPFMALLLRLMIVIIYAVGYILSMLLGTIIAVIVSFILAAINPFSWYNQPVLGIFTFMFFCVIGMVIVQTVISHIILEMVECNCFKSRRRTAKAEIEQHGETMTQFLTYSLGDERHMALLLVYALFQIMTCSSGFRSFYLVLIWSIFVVPPIVISLLAEHILSWVQQCSSVKKHKRMDDDYYLTVNNDLAQPLTPASRRSSVFTNQHRRTGSLTMNMLHPPLERDLDTMDEPHVTQPSEDTSFLTEMEDMYQGTMRSTRSGNMEYYLNTEGKLTMRERLARFFQTVVRHQLFWCIVPYVAAVIPMAFSIDTGLRLMHFMVPILERINLRVAQDVFVAAIISCIVSFSFLVLMPTMHRATNFGKLLLILFIGCLTVFITAAVIPSFTATAPKRIYGYQVVNTTFATNGTTLQGQYLTQPTFNDTFVSLTTLDGYSAEKWYLKYTSAKNLKYKYTSTTNRLVIDAEEALDTLHNNSRSFRAYTITNHTQEQLSAGKRHNLTVTIDHRFVYMGSLVLNTGENIISNFALNSQDPNVNYASSTPLLNSSTTAVIQKYGVWMDKSTVDLSVVTQNASQVISLKTWLRSCGTENVPFIASFLDFFPDMTLTGTGICTTLQDISFLLVTLP